MAAEFPYERKYLTLRTILPRMLGVDGFLNVTSLDAETSRRKATIHETMGGVSCLGSGEWEEWGEDRRKF